MSAYSLLSVRVAKQEVAWHSETLLFSRRRIVSTEWPVAEGMPHWTPILFTIWPRNLTCLWENLHFSLLNVRRALSKRCRTWTIFVLVLVFPMYQDISIIHTTPSIPSSRADILRWKCLGAEVIPKGKRFKQYLPKGVRNVLNHEESVGSGICQNPELASSFVNTWAPASCARVCSTTGRCRSLSLRFVKVHTGVEGFHFKTVDCSLQEMPSAISALMRTFSSCLSFNSQSWRGPPGWPKWILWGCGHTGYCKQHVEIVPTAQCGTYRVWHRHRSRGLCDIGISTPEDRKSAPFSNG